jgi:hypothetical protein
VPGVLPAMIDLDEYVVDFVRRGCGWALAIALVAAVLVALGFLLGRG